MAKIVKSLFSCALLVNALIYSLNCTAGEPITAVFVSDDFGASRSKVLDRVNSIYCEQKKIKFDDFKVIHYAENPQNKGIHQICDSKKKEVDFKAHKVDCEYKACDALSSIIKEYEGADIKLLWCVNRKECASEFNDVDFMRVSNDDDEIINELMNILDERRKRETVVIIYLSGSSESPKPVVTTPADSLLIEMGDSVEIRPNYKGSLSSITWSPAKSLSCSTCQFPVASPASSTTYKVQVADKNGCKSDEVNIHVQVKNNCTTGSTPSELYLVERITAFDKNTNNFSEIPSKFRRIRVQGSAASWRILSNQSGGDIYDLIANPSCGQCFRLSIVDDLGETVKTFYYKLEDVDRRASNRYHEYVPDKFVFRMDLSNMQGIKDARRTFNIKIYSYEKCGVLENYIQSKSNTMVRFDHCEVFETEDESE